MLQRLRPDVRRCRPARHPIGVPAGPFRRVGDTTMPVCQTARLWRRPMGRGSHRRQNGFVPLVEPFLVARIEFLEWTPVWRPVKNFSACRAACCLALRRRYVILARGCPTREESRILETGSPLPARRDLGVVSLVSLDRRSSYADEMVQAVHASGSNRRAGFFGAPRRRCNPVDERSTLAIVGTAR
jgi:hypothetical protein